ncbi:MAG: hypothetical protein ETSY1_34200 [Candidatus Entotheonella factor]|uniref:Uncharacterized protein n=1 Tax=Entotheonella factor TaxID=1429438 RepID=W4L905_ENTF1|nr:hypothetical protein [Candidatus Entotheonella palauensis]ETW94578.1 MAG: hypothetical protein ETSY1_34200 [Candidatus Entotheonella factor]
MSEPIKVTESPREAAAPRPQRIRIREALRAPGGMRQAVLLTEILSGPIAMRQRSLRNHMSR